MTPAPIEHSFWEHVGSLRNHVLLGASVYIALAFLAFAYVDPLTRLLLLPLHGEELVFLSVLGPFLFQMKVAMLAALVPAVPAWIAILFHFAGDGQRSRGLTVVTIFIGAAGLLAIASVTASYLYLVPGTLQVLSKVIVPGTSVVITADSYLDFFFLETIVAFIVFQLPLVINVLAYLRLLDPTKIGGKRRVVYVILLVVLAVVTPTTDVVSLLVAFLPTVLFMEVGIVLARVIHTKRAAGDRRAVN